MNTLSKGETVWYIEPECFFVAEIVRPTFEGSSEYIIKLTTVFVDNRYSIEQGEEARISFNRESLMTNSQFNKMISGFKRKAIKFLFWARWI